MFQHIGVRVPSGAQNPTHRCLTAAICAWPQVDFTRLEMAHLPAREKREEELRLYKQQQQAALAGAVSSSEALDISERQPAFLKDKGDGLFRQRNFAAAAAAYSAALAAADAASKLALTCTCGPAGSPGAPHGAGHAHKLVPPRAPLGAPLYRCCAACSRS